MKVTDSTQIMGVQLVELTTNADERGQFAEMFRVEWFPQLGWKQVQCNRSQSHAGTVRGLHFHHKQADYWHCAEGEIQVGLYDLRRSSPTRGRGEIFSLNQDVLRGLLIPAGVAHGYLATNAVTLIYVVDKYYDGSDECGLAWNDPELGLAWDLDAARPIVSPRDAANPTLGNIPESQLPA